MKYYTVLARTNSDSIYVRDAVEYINRLAAESGYASFFEEKEKSACVDFVEREIDSCDEFIKERIFIEIEEFEIEDDEE